MSFQRQVLFWGVALALLVGVLWLLSEILLPFVAGMALAYLLDPVARRLERLGMNRTLAASFILVLAVAAIVLLAILLAPILAAQLASLMENLPRYVTKLQTIVADPNQTWLTKIIGSKLPDAGKSVGELVSQGAGWIARFLASVWSGGKALFSIVSLLVITPVVAFYLLCDWDRVVATVDSWIPLHHRETVHGLVREMDVAIAAFVRGQAGICLTMGVFYALCLSLIGIQFGFVIGFIAGLIGFIPYVGALTGLLIGCLVAAAQFWPEWTPLALVIATFAAGNVIENYFLAPKLVGEKVGLHPVWLMFALIAFGYLFGFVGLLVAVPVSAAIGVLLRFALRQYRASPIYTGEVR
ncbi:MAG: AI-2E family transporter [Pseudomonadota bacterium]